VADQLSIGISQLESVVSKVGEEVTRAWSRRNQRHRYVVPLEGHHMLELFGNRTCRQAKVFLMSGNDTTDQDGARELHLNDFLCRPDSRERFVLISRPQFSALPTTINPIVLTAKFNITEQPRSQAETSPASSELDVMVTVSSWTLDGTPAKGCDFSWVTTVEGSRVVLVGG
jgi:hypothetical protein